MKYLNIVLIIILFTTQSCYQSNSHNKSNNQINILKVRENYPNSIDTNDLKWLKYHQKGKALVDEFKKLNKVDLEELIMNGSSVEKVYAFWASTEKENMDYKDYFPYVSRDTNKVNIEHVGCLVLPLQDVAIHCRRIISENIYKSNKYISDSLYLDSIAIETNWIGRISKLKPSTTFYNLIKERSLHNANTPYVTVALAKYKKEEDLYLVEKLFTKNPNEFTVALRCIAEYPHPKLENKLLDLFYNELNSNTPLFFNEICETLKYYDSDRIENAILKLANNPKKYEIHLAQLRSCITYTKKENVILNKILESKIGIENIKEIAKAYDSKSYSKRVKKRKQKYNS